jgi:hypothetical protein
VFRASELNTLTFGLSIGYAKYLNHDEFDSDSVLVAPTTALTWNLAVGPVRITLTERISYQEDTFDVPVVSNVAKYRRWENIAGIRADWDVNQFSKLGFGYQRYDVFSDDEAFEDQDRSVDTVFIRPSFQYNPHITIGLSASYSWIRYSGGSNSDGTTYLVGPYAQIRINETTDLYLEVGFQGSEFDALAQPRTAIQLVGGEPFLVPVSDDQSQSSVYYKAELSNRPSATFRHKFIVSRTQEVGVGSNFYDLTHF